MPQQSQPGLVLIDGNSLGYYYHNCAKLRRRDGTEVQAVFGFMRMLANLSRRYGHTHHLIVLWDGHAQWRYDLLPPSAEHPGYKGDRDKDPKMSAMRAAYRAIRPEIFRAVSLLGVTQITAATAEADDLAFMLSDKARKEGRRCLVVTGDGDWLQLVSETTDLHNINTGERTTLSNFHERTGFYTPRAFVEGKCLMGDSSDKVPGVGQIGEQRAIEVLAEYKSIANLIEASRKSDTSKWPKYLRDFVTNANGGIEILKRNLALMDLSRAQRPAPGAIATDRGSPNLSELRAFCEVFWFESFLLDFDGFTSCFAAYRNRTPVAQPA